MNMDPKVTDTLVGAVMAIDQQAATLWTDTPATRAAIDQLAAARTDITMVLWIDRYPLPGQRVTEAMARDALTVAGSYVDLGDLGVWAWAPEDQLRRGLETIGVDSEPT